MTARPMKALLTTTIACLAVLCLPSVAAASPPQTGTFPIDEQVTDDGASAACGFDVNVHVVGTVRYIAFFDANGDLTSIQLHHNEAGTMTANGITLDEVDHNTDTFDLVDGTETVVGIVFRESLPGLGIAIMDVGRVSATLDGTLLFEAGPHPALDGDFATLCATLTP